MICNVCGKEFQDGNAFCPFCGSAAAGPQNGRPQMQYQGNQQYGMPGQGQQYMQGQQGYGQQQGQQQFGGQQYGQPQFYNGPMQQEPPRKKSHKGAIIAIILVIVLACSGVGGYFGYKWYRNNCLENALADGDEQYKEGNYDKAISFYKEALEYDEENKQALDGIKKSELGNALADAKKLTEDGSFDESIAAYDAILEEYPDNEDAKTGKSEAKKAKLQAQIAADLEVANGYLESQDYENAITAFKTVLNEDSNNEEAKAGIITAYNAIIDKDIDDKDYETAMEDAQTALKATGDDSFQTRMDEDIAPYLIPDVDDALSAATDYLMDASNVSVSISNTMDFTMSLDSESFNMKSVLEASFKGVYDNSTADQLYTDVVSSVKTSTGESLFSETEAEIFYENKSYSYQFDGDGWEDDSDKFGYWGLLLSDGIIFDLDNMSDCEIDDTTYEIDGRQCFAIYGSYSSGDAEVLAEYAEYFYGFGIGDDVASVTATFTLYIDTETFAPVLKEIELDVLDMSHVEADIKEAFEMESVDVSDATCKYTITYDSYDELGDLTPSDM